MSFRARSFRQRGPGGDPQNYYVAPPYMTHEQSQEANTISVQLDQNGGAGGNGMDQDFRPDHRAAPGTYQDMQNFVGAHFPLPRAPRGSSSRVCARPSCVRAQVRASLVRRPQHRLTRRSPLSRRIRPLTHSSTCTMHPPPLRISRVLRPKRAHTSCVRLPFHMSIARTASAASP